MDFLVGYKTDTVGCIKRLFVILAINSGLLGFQLPFLSAQFGEVYHYRAHGSQNFENIKQADPPIWVRIGEEVITISLSPFMTYEFTYSYSDYQDAEGLGCVIYKLDLVTMVDSYNRDLKRRKVAPPFRRLEEGSYMVCDTESGYHFGRLQYEFVTMVFIDKIE